ncbi:MULTISPECIES: hypothetical protein [Asticcacaulis]|uniref:hypothetical protein n=1 Tax=Asticcacaulis TaxID=76890 RepID=UPI001AE693CE|nr:MULTISPECIES: hypothetical protein [Asticcacaulis]MBP2161316.1 hypothetical protein [Asticcacaulis solisilvae]MDR6802318.1 hypothetical protein [Asticcacaulis sp. BE141]
MLDIGYRDFRFTYKPHVVVVVAVALIANGIIALSGPWWAAIVEALLGVAGLTDVAVRPWQTLVGVMSLLLGVALASYKFFVLDLSDRQRAHDRQLFDDKGVSLPELDSYFRNLVDDHSYRSSLDTVFRKSYDTFAATGSTFQHPAVKAKYDAYRTAAIDLHAFAIDHFSIFPETQPIRADYRYCLAPEYNFDRAMVDWDASKAGEYDGLKKLLHDKVDVAQRAFGAHVNEIQKV